MVKSVVTALWLLCAIHDIFGITVSPDLGRRNGSHPPDLLRNEPLRNDKESRMIDRYRRLIPYMTFYIPTNLPINEYYNYNQIQYQMQQQPPPAVGGGGPPVAVYKPPVPQQITRLQPHVHGIGGGGRPVNYNHPRYPSPRPNYQTIAYNTRHQTGETGGNNHNQIHQTSHQQQIEHVQLPPPLSFKDANMEVPFQSGLQSYKQPPQKQTVTPFTNTNKLPGQFTPIIYTDTEDDPKPQSDGIKQYDENVQEQQLVTGGGGPTSTPTPAYPIYEEIPQKPERTYQVRQESEQQPQELTPQQKYVIYLQQQLIYQNQRQKSQQQSPNYIDVVSSTALPPVDNHIVYEKSPAPPTITYTQPDFGTDSEEEIYNQIPEQPVSKPKPTRAPPRQLESKPSYLEYLEEQQRQAQRVLDEYRQNPPRENYNPNIYIPTPAPTYISQVPQSYKPVLELHYRPEPLFRVRTPGSNSGPAPVRQHLTETTQTAAPVLTTYHPQIYPSSTPAYNSHLTLSRTEKRKLAQRNRLIAAQQQQIHTQTDPILIGNNKPIASNPNPDPSPRPVYRPNPVLISHPNPQPDPIIVSHGEPQPDSIEVSRPERPDPIEVRRPDRPDPIESTRPEQVHPLEISRPETVDPIEVSRPERPSPIVVSSPEQSDSIEMSRPEQPQPIVVTRPEPQPDPIELTKPSPKYQPTTRAPPRSVYQQNQDPLPDLATSSLAEILRKLQETNHLPQTLTPDNIDNSIRTLIKILNNLKQTQTINADPPQHHEEDYEYEEVPSPVVQSVSDPKKNHGPTTGIAGVDYPNLSEIPKTNFNCKEQRYKGFFGDPETSCQVWHYCDLNGGQASFLCPNGTIFSQIALTCDWWFNVKCSTTTQLYVLNERLYKYILPFTPKFPEDYSGPLVDKYLALKFQEMEEKMRREKLKGKLKAAETDSKNDNTETKENSSEEDDEPEDNSSIDTGLPYPSIDQHSTTTDSSNSISPIVVSSTPDTYLSNGIPSTTTTYAAIASSELPYDGSIVKPKTSVESEKVEVIEIKTDGSSGHLSPTRNYESNK